MSYIGNQPFTAAFLTDTFSGNGSTVAFTMTVAPANTSSIIVAITGVLQDPSTYSVSGTTLTFSAAPPSGTSNISVRYLGIPASGVTTTAYRTVTEFTATSGQTSFSVPSYTVGYIDVYRNGVMLGTADFTATTGTTVVLATGATTGDLIRTESFYVSSVLNAIPATAGSVSDSYIVGMSASKLTGTQTIPKATLPTGCILQVVQSTLPTQVSTTSTSYQATGLIASLTPTSSTSKILVIVSGGGAYNSGANVGGANKLYRQIASGGYLALGANGMDWANAYNSASSNVVPHSYTYLDSPATTSTVYYQPYFRVDPAGTAGTAYFNIAYYSVNIPVVTLTLMEVSA